MQKRKLCGAIALFGAALVPLAAHAQDAFPTRPIRLVVPYAAGGGNDITARVLAPRLAEILGQQVVIDNRPGGASIIGTEIVAKAPPDGHTLMMASIAFAANAGLWEKLPYDPTKDFAPVTLLGTVPMVLTVNPTVPAKSVADVIKLAKEKPGSLNYASGGPGGANHLAGELFKNMTGTNIVHVPYKGGSGIVTALLGNEVDLAFATTSTAQPYFASGKMIPLGATTSKRISTLPNVPTIAESGVPGYEIFDWQGVIAPGGTPKAVIDKLNDAFVKALGYPEVREKILGLGMELAGTTSQQFGNHINSEVAKWRRIAKEANIKGE